jgi:Zn-dependent peptidase ImmA (M78 family)
MASGPWAPRDVERRANAFAAMLLMPRDLVQRTVSTVTVRLDTVEGIGQVANRLRAGFLATLRHLTNLGFIDETEQERIQNERDRISTGRPDGR